MNITSSQMAAFRGHSKERYATRLARWIKDGFADAVAARGFDDRMVDQLSRQIIDLADRHGMRLENDVTTFAGCILTLESSLVGDPRYPWADEILKRTDLSGTKKASLLHDHVVFSFSSSR